MKTFVVALLVAFAYSQDDGADADAAPAPTRSADAPALDSDNYAFAAGDCASLVEGIFGGPAKTLVTRGRNTCDEACVETDAFDRGQDAALCACIDTSNAATEDEILRSVGIDACECASGISEGTCETDSAFSLAAGVALIATSALLF